MRVKDKTELATLTQQTLANLAAEANEISELIAKNNGEITPEIEERLNFNTQALIAKVDNYIFREEQLERDIILWKSRVAASRAICESFERALEIHRSRVKAVMLEMGVKEIRGNLNQYSISNRAPKLVISDPAKIPSDCKMVVSETVPDKEKIKALLTDGYEIPGAGLEPVYALTCKPSRGRE